MTKICTLLKDKCAHFNNGICIATHYCGGNAKDIHEITVNELLEINIINQAKILKTQQEILKFLEKQR